MQTEAEVLTDYNELICSTNIEHIVIGRNAALQQINNLIQQLSEISTLTNSIGGGTANDWGQRDCHRFGCWLTEPVDAAMKAITRSIDRDIWRDLMLKSGMLALMDAQARDEWHRNLEASTLPEISEANILSTFKQLHHSKGEVFERGIINLFKGLSWDYRTNSPCRFGKKIVMTGLVRHDKWGFSLNWGRQRDQLADLDRMLNLLDGKPIPENRHDLTVKLSEHINKQRTASVYNDDFFTIRYFQKGTAHIIFKRADLVDKMNDILAKHYPSALPAKA